MEMTREIVLALAESGADIIELGIPFSDPIADGPVIQRSSLLAMKHGYSLSDYIELVRSIRKHTDVGLIFMSYLNPALKFGLDVLDEQASEAGLDGILLSDLTPDEFVRMEIEMKLDSIFLAAPTSSEERLKTICEVSRGFIYLVTQKGVTGSSTDLGQFLPGMVSKIRKYSELPVAAGFGISTARNVEQVWQIVDGAIVGTAIVKFILEHQESKDLPGLVSRFVQKKLLP